MSEQYWQTFEGKILDQDLKVVCSFESSAKAPEHVYFDMQLAAAAPKMKQLLERIELTLYTRQDKVIRKLCEEIRAQVKKAE